MNKEQTSGRSAAKHTPGPWSVGRTITGNKEWTKRRGELAIWDTIVESKDFILCHPAGTSPLEALANARLIAAAPEMLEALQGLLAYAETQNPSPNTSRSIMAARAAIAKAKGE